MKVKYGNHTKVELDGCSISQWQDLMVQSNASRHRRHPSLRYKQAIAYFSARKANVLNANRWQVGCVYSKDPAIAQRTGFAALCCGAA